jgi:hypothetical protein
MLQPGDAARVSGFFYNPRYVSTGSFKKNFADSIKVQNIKKKYTLFREPRFTLEWEAPMGEALLDRVISIISGDNEPDADKRILLKMINRDLTQNRFASFYRMKTEEAAPAFASFIYEVYRLVYPAQVFFSRPESDGLLKQLCAEAFMDSHMVEAARRLSPESIEKRTQTTGEGVLISSLNDDLNLLDSFFNQSPRRLGADNCYRLLGLINAFVNFNFMPLLQKFDPALGEGAISVTPKFKPLRLEYITDDINDFMGVSTALGRGEDWRTAIGVLNAANSRIAGTRMTGGQPAGNAPALISPEQWQNLLIKLGDIHQAKILPLMVQHALKNPVWQRQSKTPAGEKPAESWFDETSIRVQGLINRLSSSMRNTRIESLAKMIFGSADIIRLRHYTREEDEMFQRKNLGGFTYVAGLNYLLAFIQDYMNKEIRELCDLLLIRGQWTIIEASREASEALFQINDMTEDLAAFDGLLAESGKLGSRLKSDLSRVDREAFRANQIRSILAGVNAQALGLINAAASSLFVLGKHLKNLIHDYGQTPHEQISNWKELEVYSKNPIGPRMDAAYKNIYHFIQLMRIFAAL